MESELALWIDHNSHNLIVRRREAPSRTMGRACSPILRDARLRRAPQDEEFGKVISLQSIDAAL
jgi:hypothetical protein